MQSLFKLLVRSIRAEQAFLIPLFAVPEVSQAGHAVVLARKVQKRLLLRTQHLSVAPGHWTCHSLLMELPQLPTLFVHFLEVARVPDIAKTGITYLPRNV